MLGLLYGKSLLSVCKGVSEMTEKDKDTIRELKAQNRALLEVIRVLVEKYGVSKNVVIRGEKK